MAFIEPRDGTRLYYKAVLVSAVTPYLLKTDDHPDGSVSRA